MAQPRLRDLGVAIGAFPTGPSNTLTDVPGLRVGHQPLVRGDNVRTGVTAIWPHDGNPMSERVYAGIHVLTGYGEIILAFSTAQRIPYRVPGG